MEPIKRLVIGVYGDVKTAKTSLLLTAPKPIYHVDFDQGIDRAIWRFPDLRVGRLNRGNGVPQPNVFKDHDIVSKEYLIPIEWPGSKPKGFVEFWEKTLLPDLQSVCESPDVSTIGIDTGTIMWHADTRAQLERVQQSQASRQSLLPVEYRRPNDEMRALLGAVKSTGKNLVITHHLEGVYETQWVKKSARADPELLETRVGETWAGWNHLGGLVDIIARCFIDYGWIVTFSSGSNMSVTAPTESIARKMVPTERAPNMIGVFKATDIDPVPYLIIEKCGLTLKAEGSRLDNPTFDYLINYLNALRVADANGNTG